jgi:hypothetical protein
VTVEGSFPCVQEEHYFLWLCSPARAIASSSTRFLDHTQRRATVGRTPQDELSARRKDTQEKHTDTSNPSKKFNIRAKLPSKPSFLNPSISV